MVTQDAEIKRRNDLMCLSIRSVYDKLKYLAKQSELTLSGYLKFLIAKEYKRERRKCDLGNQTNINN